MLFIRNFRETSCNRKRRRCCGSIQKRYSDKPYAIPAPEERLPGAIFCLYKYILTHNIIRDIILPRK